MTIYYYFIIYSVNKRLKKTKKNSSLVTDINTSIKN